jgi:hypothetical protein
VADHSIIHELEGKPLVQVEGITAPDEVTTHSIGIAVPLDWSIAARVSTTSFYKPLRTVWMRRRRAMPNAALLPVPNLPRPGRPARRSRFSPCIVK